VCLAVATTALMTLGGSAFAAGDAAKGKAAFAAKCTSCHQEGLGANPFFSLPSWPCSHLSWDDGMPCSALMPFGLLRRSTARALLQ
jgi:hypothetical protein